MTSPRSVPMAPPKPSKAETKSLAALFTGRGSDGLRPDAEAAGFACAPSREAADLVIVYGGDGSLLGADRDFPDLPKLVIRRANEYIKCPEHQDAAVFARILAGEQTRQFLPRLAAQVGPHHFRAINDIVLHNAKVTAGVRYSVKIDNEIYADEIVGDGLVVSTPFGSSAYYRSITKSVFRVGIGLAFNNSTESVNHLILRDSSLIEVLVTRGPALVAGDNMMDPVAVDRGDLIRISSSGESAEIWELETLLCMNCKSRETGRPAGFRHV
ncbi:hypothetical protein BH09SUM1_BH09SUM1_27630 [soil metagenome]